MVKITLQDFLNAMRIELFRIYKQSIFAKILNLSASKYSRYVNAHVLNSKSIEELTDGLVSALETKGIKYDEIIKFALKKLKQDSEIQKMQDYIYLSNCEHSNNKDLKQVIKCIILLLVSVNNEQIKKMRNDFYKYIYPYHTEKRYWSTKLIELSETDSVLFVVIERKLKYWINIILDSPHINFEIVLLEQELDSVEIVENEFKYNGIENVNVYKKDLDSYIKENNIPDFTLFYYSFHHITDDEKFTTIKKITEKMNLNSYFCVIDAFLEEKDDNYNCYKEYFDSEGVGITKQSICGQFIENLRGLSKNDISLALEMEEKAKFGENQMMEKTIKRDGEYLVKLSTVQNYFKKLRIDVKFAKNINTFTDKAVIVQKN